MKDIESIKYEINMVIIKLRTMEMDYYDVGAGRLDDTPLGEYCISTSMEIEDLRKRLEKAVKELEERGSKDED